MFKFKRWADTDNRRPSDPGEISPKASRSQPFGYPAIGLLSAHAGDKQTEVSIKLLKRSFRLLLYLKRFHLTDGAR